MKKKKKLEQSNDEKNIVKSLKETLSIEKEVRDKKISDKISSICRSIEISAVPKRMREGYVSQDEDSEYDDEIDPAQEEAEMEKMKQMNLLL